MVDNQHRQIVGYRDLTQPEIDLINEIKQLEQEIGDLYRTVGDQPNIDGTWLFAARLHLTEGISALVRAVARPVDPFGDDDEIAEREADNAPADAPSDAVAATV